MCTVIPVIRLDICRSGVTLYFDPVENDSMCHFSTLRIDPANKSTLNFDQNSLINDQPLNLVQEWGHFVCLKDHNLSFIQARIM